MKLAKQLLIAASVLAAANVYALTHTDGAVAYEDIEATPIVIVGAPKTTLGQDFKYPAGQPLIKAFNIEIPVGKQTSLHKHLVPLYIYIVSGDLEVDYGSKGKKIYKPGTSYVEAIDWCHIGKVSGKVPVKVIGVYLGEQTPDQIKPDVCTKPN
ncbi:cupin domain-containing protein [Polynucleobacter sp. 15G-AUS-farblos]|uniref:cupin domain-containing protein n=1 Tax=Polynucleobacter sp. 15G-AUS-farblos TaxID=2689094 RepID=UPI001C0D269F|nr:cupin domain-containing protein [Polynucleobacter sp. 15G-AUS-farblos]MBU3583110.1 cupin domain-containing protein [Polynucleobacter sp. 15G-AUS-farblos]